MILYNRIIFYDDIGYLSVSISSVPAFSKIGLFSTIGTQTEEKVIVTEWRKDNFVNNSIINR